MVSLLKKLYIVLCAALFVTFAGSVSLEINDSGTWRNLDEVYVNDSSTWRQIKQIQHNDSGTWRTSYHADIYQVTIGNAGSAYGFHTGGSGIGSMSTTTVTVLSVSGVVGRMVNTTIVTELVICTNSALTQTSFTKLLLYGDASTYVEHATASANIFVPTSGGSNICSDLGFSVYNFWSWNTVAAPWPGDTGQVRKALIVR